MKKGSTPIRILCVALVMVVLGSALAALFHTSFNSVNISRIEIEGAHGTMTALLYMPKGAGPSDPRPVIVTTHGYLNTKEMQDAPAIEMSRRGYIVIATDMYDHGDSRWTEDIPVGGHFGTFWIWSQFDAAIYAYQQPYTLKDAKGNGMVAVSGHSMGGFSSLIALYMDEMASLQSGVRMIHAGIPAGADYGYAAAIATQADYEAAFGSRTVGMIAGQFDEFFFNKTAGEKSDAESKVTGTVVKKDYAATLSGKSFLGVGSGQTAEANKFYTVTTEPLKVGENIVRAGETGQRIIYTPYETHPWNHFSTGTTADFINFYAAAFKGVTTPTMTNAGLPASNQIWIFKEIFNFVAMIGFFLLIVPVASLLLKLPFFKLAVTAETPAVPAPESTGGKAAYWIALVFCLAFPAALFSTLMDRTDKLNILFICGLVVAALGVAACVFGFVKKQDNLKIGGIVFAVVSGLLALVFKFPDKFMKDSPYFIAPTVHQIGYWAVVCGLIVAVITIGFYYLVKKPAGAAFNNNYGISTDIKAICASLCVALVTIAGGYILLFLAQGVLKVDFRLWTLAVRTFTWEHVVTTLRYAPFFLVYYFVNTVALNANTRGRKGGYVIAVLLNVGGLAVWLLLQYGLLFIRGVSLQPTQALNGILLVALTPCLGIAAVYARKLYEKTNNVWLPAFLNTLLFTLISCANTAVFWNTVAA